MRSVYAAYGKLSYTLVMTGTADLYYRHVVCKTGAEEYVGLILELPIVRLNL